MEAAQEHRLRRGEPTGGVEDHLRRGSVAGVDGLDRPQQHLPWRHQVIDARAVVGEQVQNLNAMGRQCVSAEVGVELDLVELGHQTVEQAQRGPVLCCPGQHAVGACDGGPNGLAADRGGERSGYGVTGEREVPCSQTFGNLGQGAEPHVGEATNTSDGPAHGDAGDTGRDDHVDGSERIAGPNLIEDSAQCRHGSGTRAREQDSTHDRHRIGWH